MADAAPATAVSRFARLTDEGLLDRLAPGLYAWGITVAWPASQKLAPLPSRVLAGVALLSLLAAAALSRFWASGARIAGLWGFVGSSLGTWVLLARTLGPTRLDPLQGILGWVGWALFAVTWGGSHFTRAGASSVRPPRDVSSAPSAAGSPPSPGAAAVRRHASRVMAAIAIAAAVPLILAWWVESTERALLAHAVSLAAAIALVSLAVEPALASRASAQVVVLGGRSSSRLLDASTSLLVLAGLLLLGAVYGLLR